MAATCLPAAAGPVNGGEPKPRGAVSVRSTWALKTLNEGTRNDKRHTDNVSTLTVG